MEETISILKSAGALLVPITDKAYNTSALGRLDVQRAEFRETMDTYLSDPLLGGDHPTTLAELYSTGKFLVLPSGYEYVNTALRSSTSNFSYSLSQFSIQNLTTVLRGTFTAHRLDAMIYPEQKNLVAKLGSPLQPGRNGILAALTGFPVVTVPAGFSDPSEDAPLGVPIGMEILGVPWSETKLLNVAARLADLKHVRKMPAFANRSVEARGYSQVPTIIPNRSNIPSAYPVGVL